MICDRAFCKWKAVFWGAPNCIECIIRDRSQYKAQIHHSESQYDYKAFSLATSKEGIYIMLTLWQLWDILIQEMLKQNFNSKSRFKFSFSWMMKMMLRSLAKFLEYKIYTEKTRKLRQNTQKIANFLRYYGKIHSKLPIFALNL